MDDFGNPKILKRVFVQISEKAVVFFQFGAVVRIFSLIHNTLQRVGNQPHVCCSTVGPYFDGNCTSTL